MEATLRPKKRKQPSPSDPFAVIFTRSKSEIYLHRNRSGRSRSDRIRRPNHVAESERPQSKLKLSASNQHDIPRIKDHDIPHISIKDLRARRVFSPPSIIDDSSGEVEKFDLGFNFVDKGLDNRNPNLGQIVNCGDRVCMEVGESEKVEKGLTCISEDLNMVSPKLAGTDRGTQEGIELCVQMAPKVNENGEVLNGSVARTERKRNDSISKSKLGPRSRQMIFRTSSSFSYRRLLPVLMDIAKANSCDLKNEKSLSRFSCKVQNSNDKSPNSSSIIDDCISIKGEDLGQDCDKGKIEDSGKMENLCRESSCKVQDLNVSNPNIIHGKGNAILHDVEQRNSGDSENSDRAELTEDHIEMTPPDADIFSKPEVSDNLENREENYLQTDDGNLLKSANESISGNDSSVVDQSLHTSVYRRRNSTLKSQLVLNPCSRLKVFKTPASFSYRRLLPFLMDIAKEDSCTLKGNECPKVEVVEEKPQICQETPIDACKTESFSMEDQTCDKGPNLPPAIWAPTECSSHNELNLLPAMGVTEMEMPDFQKKKILQVEQVKSDTPKKLEPNHDRLSSIQETTSTAMSLLSPRSPEALSGDDVSEAFHCSSVIAKENHKVSQVQISKGAMTIEGVSLDQNSSQMEAYVPSGILAGGPPRGILKRSPRGCRGLCNCLNCASFRLHADRAFEFSRNQMQDTEEVVLELTKELSYLRNILEKAAIDSNDHVVHVNQAKEACLKAFKAEQQAKSRLSEMNYDLNIHCRSACLQRPRVRFADSPEEKVISKVDLPTR